MADTITFTPGGTGGTAVTITPVPGTLQLGGDHDDRGGGQYGQARSAIAANGSVETELDSVTVTQAALLALMGDTATDAAGNASPIGYGDVAVTGAGEYASVVSYAALLDLTLTDKTMRAVISWKGRAVE